MTQRTVTHHHKRAGFSLIEVLVSTALLVLLLMTATTMMMTFLVSNAKSSVRHTVKGEGSFALAKMEHLIRNAETTEITCDQFGGNDEISIKLKNFDDSDKYTLETTGNQISYKSDIAGTTEYLTSTGTRVANLNFNCYGSTSGARRITISFALSETVTSVQADTDITENFRTVVQIRN